MTKCQQEIRDGESGNPIEECVKEEDSVYYRFCGAALSSMLHSRYEKRVEPDKKDYIQREIVVLRAIKCDDKSHTEIVALSRILSLGREV